MNNHKSKPWWYRLQSWINIQLAVINCLGFFTYLRANYRIHIKSKKLKKKIVQDNT